MAMTAKAMKYETFKGLIGRRKIEPADIEAAANLVATKNMQLKQACLVLELNYESFSNHLSLRKNKGINFDEIVDKIKQKHLSKLVGSIESSGLGINDRKADWRAAAWIAERLAPSQFGQAEKPQAQLNTINVVMLDAVKRVFLDSPMPEPATNADGQTLPSSSDRQLLPSSQTIDVQELPASAPAPVRLPIRKPKPVS